MSVAEGGPDEAVSQQGEDPEVIFVSRNLYFWGSSHSQHFLFLTASLEYSSLVLFHFHHFTDMSSQSAQWALGALHPGAWSSGAQDTEWE